MVWYILLKIMTLVRAQSHSTPCTSSQLSKRAPSRKALKVYYRNFVMQCRNVHSHTHPTQAMPEYEDAQKGLPWPVNVSTEVRGCSYTGTFRTSSSKDTSRSCYVFYTSEKTASGPPSPLSFGSPVAKPLYSFLVQRLLWQSHHLW